MSELAAVRLFLCGDVMTGRGIDQILPHPSIPTLYEGYVSSAIEYVELAERANGRVPRGVDPGYIWGDALAELDERSPDLRIINLETSVTTSEDAAPKGINYRMHPSNMPCLQAAEVDCCVLANNHVLDWGVGGLLETLDTMQRAGIATAGAGRTAEEAAQPAVLDTGAGRVLVYAFGSPSSGVPRSSAAGEDRPGVQVLTDLSEGVAERVCRRIRAERRPGDVVMVSIHWGGNWGYEIPSEQRRFAHRLIDEGGVDVVHGHSSHHPKGIERYRDRLILYGCGDFINDYEGIGGYEQFRSDLVLAYFVTVDNGTGTLIGLDMVPFRLRRFRLDRASRDDGEWLRHTLGRECEQLGTGVDLSAQGVLQLRW